MELLMPPLAAETMFNIGAFPVTNAYINSTLAMIGFAIFAFSFSHFYKKVSDRSSPSGFVNSVESLVDFILGYFDQVTGDRKMSYKFLPFVGTFFLFILVSNWMGLLPGTGTIGIWQMHGSKVELIPLLRPANTDLNMTVAMAVMAIMGSHILGVMAIGFFKYANRFIKLGDLYKAVISCKPVNILTAVIEFFVGLIEIFSEVAKMVSLSLRLYGNIFAGEVLLTVLASLIALFVPLPFMGLEILVGLIQAVVFSMLTLVYLNMATTKPVSHESH